VVRKSGKTIWVAIIGPWILVQCPCAFPQTATVYEIGIFYTLDETHTYEELFCWIWAYFDKKLVIQGIYRFIQTTYLIRVIS